MNAFEMFLDGNDPIFLLSGSAGTGKTSLIASLIGCLSQKARPFAALAPTGRAARILGSKTRTPASTIHREIYLLGDVEVFEEAESSNDPGLRLHFPLKQDDPGETVFIVDEASMVGDRETKGDVLQFGSGRLLTDLIQYARVGRPGRAAGTGARLVFVGDPAQLPPVGEVLSPALSARYLKDTFGLECVQFELTEVLRQASGSAVLECATALRAAIGSGAFSSFEIPAVDGEILPVDVSDAVQHVTDGYRTRSSSILITHTNEQARDLNRAVRGRLWNDERACIQHGDVLLVNRNSPLTGLLNGDLVKVIDASAPAETRAVRIKGLNHAVSLTFRPIKLAYRDGDGSVVEVDCRLLENLLDSPERDLTPAEQRALLVDFWQRNPSLKLRTAEFSMAIRKDPYFNALQVKYGYALTCHKAQGGEWDTAVVNFSSGRGKDNEDFFRWAYTAITRGRKQLLTVSAPKFDLTSRMRWDSGHPAHDIGDSQSTDAPLALDEDWDRFSFCAGQDVLFGYHLALRDAWAADDISVDRLDHQQYCERYRVTHQGKHADVQYQYKRNMKVSTVGAAPGLRSDVALAERCVSLMRGVLLKSPSPVPGTLDPFLLEFQGKLESSLQASGVRIIGIAPMQYRARISFQREGLQASIDFHYDKKKRWTRAVEVGGPGSSRGIYSIVQRALGEAT